MTVLGINSPGARALTLLRQSNISAPSHSAKVNGAASATEKAAVVYGGSLSRDGGNPVDAIRRILGDSRAQTVPAAASAAGRSTLEGALSRFSDAKIALSVDVDGRRFAGVAASALGDKNIGYIADYADQVITNDKDAMAKLAALSKASAARPGASQFSKIIHEAFVAGEVELVAASEFGVETKRTKTFNFSASGQFLGSSSTNDNEAGTTTVGELYQTRFLLQDDGARIDVETGRYASYVDVGGRDYFMFIDRPED